MTLNNYLMNLIVAAFVATIFLALTSTGRATEPRRVVVEITGFKFVPERPALVPGDIVTWVNKDIVPHTARIRAAYRFTANARRRRGVLRAPVPNHKRRYEDANLMQSGSLRPYAE